MIIHLPIFDKQTTCIDAVTLGPVIIVWAKEPSDTLIRHEKEHSRQFRADPFLFYPKYFYEMIRNKLNGMSWREAYLSISYEVEAREKSKEQ